MSINSIGAGSAASTAALQQQAAMPNVGREREGDRDRDDGTKAAAKPAATVNMSGQAIGTLINVAA